MTQVLRPEGFALFDAVRVEMRMSERAMDDRGGAPAACPSRRLLATS